MNNSNDTYNFDNNIFFTHETIIWHLKADFCWFLKSLISLDYI